MSESRINPADLPEKPAADSRWPEGFRHRVRLLQRMLALLFTIAGAVMIYLGMGPLVSAGSGWLTALGAFLLLCGGQAILFGPYYLARLEQHRQAPN